MKQKKHMKKIVSILLTLVMALGLITTAFATEMTTTTTTESGSITISNVLEGDTYNIYKLFALTYDGNAVAYTYTTEGTVAKDGSVTGDELYTALSDNDSPFTLTATTKSGVYSVSLKNKYFNEDGTYLENADDEIAKWLKTNVFEASVEGSTKSLIEATATGVASANANNANNVTYIPVSEGTNNTASLKFSGLEFGYYYVTSSLGSLVMLNSTTPDATINEKNTIPFLEKKIVVGDEDKTETSASIGDTVNFKITVTDGKGTNQDITIHDTMESGLDFEKAGNEISASDFDISITKQDGSEITIKDNTGKDVTVSEGNSLMSALENANMLTVSNQGNEAENKCTFEITLKAALVEQLNEKDQVVITYSAILNENAVIYSKNVGDFTNDNIAWLVYNGHNSEESKVSVSTYAIAIYKSDVAGEELAGASFTLKDSGDNAIYVKETSTDENSNNEYVVVQKGGTMPDGAMDTVVSPASGVIIIKGVKLDTYSLTETEAPQGYNLLKEAESIEVTVDGLVSSYSLYIKDGEILNPNTTDVTSVTPTVIINASQYTYDVLPWNVINNTGSTLPSTGGIGTTIFYVIGVIIVAGVAVILVTRRRMNAGR